MPAFGVETILRELLGWLTLLVLIGGALVAVSYLRLSSWMFLVAAGLGGMIFQNLLSRIFILFAAHLNAGQNIQAVMALFGLIGFASWVCLVAGLVAVFRDVAERLRFLEEQQESRAR